MIVGKGEQWWLWYERSGTDGEEVETDLAIGDVDDEPREEDNFLLIRS